MDNNTQFYEPNDFDTVEEIAREMYAELQRTGQAMERRWKEDMKLILRLSPDYQRMQLILVGTYRQANLNERDDVRLVFGVPDEHGCDSTYVRGNGILRYTWPITGLTIPHQLTLWDLPDYLADHDLEIIPDSLVWNLGMKIPVIQVKRRQEVER